jgi:hypothetical protein
MPRLRGADCREKGILRRRRQHRHLGRVIAPRRVRLRIGDRVRDKRSDHANRAGGGWDGRREAKDRPDRAWFVEVTWAVAYAFSWAIVTIWSQ